MAAAVMSLGTILFLQLPAPSLPEWFDGQICNVRCPGTVWSEMRSIPRQAERRGSHKRWFKLKMGFILTPAPRSGFESLLRICVGCWLVSADLDLRVRLFSTLQQGVFLCFGCQLPASRKQDATA